MITFEPFQGSKKIPMLSVPGVLRRAKLFDAFGVLRARGSAFSHFEDPLFSSNS